MNVDVSRALASFISDLGLSRETARQLASRFGDVNSVDDLPEWILDEDSDTSRSTIPDADDDGEDDDLDPDIDDIVAGIDWGDDEAERSDLDDDDDEIIRAMDRNQLKHYWTKGKGLRKWLGHPHPWTALYKHLRKYVGAERAKRMAAQWVHDVTGNWPGSDAHRVATGHKPRGSRIGPG